MQSDLDELKCSVETYHFNGKFRGGPDVYNTTEIDGVISSYKCWKFLGFIANLMDYAIKLMDWILDA